MISLMKNTLPMTKKIVLSFFAAALIVLNLQTTLPFTFADEVEFSDVFPSDPVNDSLDNLVPLGVIKGYDDGTFRPLNFVNRAEFTKMIIKANGIEVSEKSYSSCFPDTPQVEWYTPYICEAYERGWVQGFNDGLFHPEETISTAEGFSILSKAFEWDMKKVSQIKEMPYSDVKSDDWFVTYIDFAKRNNILQELSYYLSPNKIMDRKSAAIFIDRSNRFEEGGVIDVELKGEYEDSYQDILATGIQPAIPVDYAFPHKSQSGYPLACYGFSVINLTNYKYSAGLDIEGLANTIGWDKEGIWESEVFDKYATEYDSDILFIYYGSPAFVLNKLAYGEPVIMYRNYEVNGENVGHQAAAFSFDDVGIYFGDSANGQVTRIPYEELFLEEWGDGKSLNVYEYRKLKGDGVEKVQWGDLDGGSEATTSL